MSGARKYTIAIRPSEGERVRKVTKIIGLNGDGFSILAPYHKAREGFLFKMPIDPSVHKPGPHQLPWDQAITYTANDRVKLSYHSDGFAQFSSETQGQIISGRDPQTGEPKGLGLFTHPLRSPIWSGPSVSVMIWGIEDFEESGAEDDLVIFEPTDFYYRGCSSTDANSWMLAIYAFQAGITPPVQFYQGQPVVETSLESLNAGMTSVVRLRIITLPKELVFLGLMVNRTITGFPSSSGWMLNGPGDFTSTRRGHVLMGIYPRIEVPTALGTLDRSVTNATESKP